MHRSIALVTLIALVGITATISWAQAPDSISFAKLLVMPDAVGTRKNLIMQSTGPFVVRQGDWKLIAGKGSGGWTRVKPSKSDPAGQLYNLADDPGEKNNRYDQEPETVTRMTALLHKYQAEGRSRPAHEPKQ